ncbi:hypothetical protein M501DRAFT_433225 [Patellaria atrata CBS 101060]|uniref:Pentatricopeptide repeat protein n=1 Tax=Patellaria atrata CBS 101060 TaxID=1346257 RepID=A0A9P4S484_9PEZI|nr:hypothetical protein M501DRAFT_433225 [Patellaria atrata CBS 101060]
MPRSLTPRCVHSISHGKIHNRLDGSSKSELSTSLASFLKCHDNPSGEQCNRIPLCNLPWARGWNSITYQSKRAPAELKQSRRSFLHTIACNHSLGELEIRVPGQNSLSLRNVNAQLRAARVNEEDFNRRNKSALWLWYTRAKLTVPGFLFAIPERTWELLYKITASNIPHDCAQRQVLKVLHEDMRSIGRDARVFSPLASIEALFRSGQQHAALLQWRQSRENFADLQPEYLLSGIGMHAVNGDIPFANKLLRQLLTQYRYSAPAFRLAVLEAPWGYLLDSKEISKVYGILKQEIGVNAMSTSFSRIFNTFLNCKDKDLAVSFVSDICQLTRSIPPEVNVAITKIQSSMTTAEEIDALSLSALTFLPQSCQDKYFYGTWIKKLVDLNDLDRAAEVVELMYEKGQRPTAAHINALINAWLLRGSKVEREMAERMALAMIDRRVAIATRQKGEFLKRDVGIRDTTTMNDGRFYSERILPSAPIATFTILVKYYLKEQMYHKVQYVKRKLYQANMQKDAVFTNHLMHAELQTKRLRRVWSLYKVLKQSSQSPNMVTYERLWYGLREHVRNPKHSYIRGYPPARKLFAEMIQYAQKSRRTGEEFRTMIQKVHKEYDLYHMIVKCFCRTNDLPGLLVAFHTLHVKWNIPLHENTPLVLATQVAAIGLPNRTARLRWLSRTSGLYENQLHMTQMAMQLIYLARQDKMKAKGCQLENMDPKQHADMKLHVISEFLRIVMVLKSDPAEVEESIEGAKKEMAVTGLGSTGDVDSFQVA